MSPPDFSIYPKDVIIQEKKFSLFTNPSLYNALGKHYYILSNPEYGIFLVHYYNNVYKIYGKYNTIDNNYNFDQNYTTFYINNYFNTYHNVPAFFKNSLFLIRRMSRINRRLRVQSLLRSPSKIRASSPSKIRASSPSKIRSPSKVRASSPSKVRSPSKSKSSTLKKSDSNSSFKTISSSSSSPATSPTKSTSIKKAASPTKSTSIKQPASPTRKSFSKNK